MKYRTYNPERECIEKFLRSAKSEMLHVTERIGAAEMLQDDAEKIETINRLMNELLNKLKQEN